MNCVIAPRRKCRHPVTVPVVSVGVWGIRTNAQGFEDVHKLP